VFSSDRPSVVQIANEDGTVKLRVPDPRKYYDEIAREINETYEGYSDVTIVCGDGASLDANRAVLSRFPPLSHYLRTQNASDESKPVVCVCGAAVPTLADSVFLHTAGSHRARRGHQEKE
jgi:hypothetical protein